MGFKEWGCFKKSALITCILAGIGLIVYVALGYFGYHVVVDRDQKNVDMTQTPDLMACIAISCMKRGLQNRTVYEIYDNTRPIKRQVKKFTINRNGKIEDVNVNSVLDETLHLLKHMNCHSFRTKNKDMVSAFKIRALASDPYFYKLEIDPTRFGNCDKIYLHVSAPGTLSDATGKFNHIVIGYRQKKTHRLPSPFTSDCRDYASEAPEHYSRIDCIDKCLIRRAINLFNKLPSSALLSKYLPVVGRDNQTMANYTIMSDIDNQDPLYLQAIDECKNVTCRQVDCNEDVYIVKVISTFASANGNMILEYRVTDEPVETYTTLPKMSWAQFIIDILSLLALVTGLSLWSLLSDHFPKIWEWLKGRCKCGKKQDEVTQTPVEPFTTAITPPELPSTTASTDVLFVPGRGIPHRIGSPTPQPSQSKSTSAKNARGLGFHMRLRSSRRTEPQPSTTGEPSSSARGLHTAIEMSTLAVPSKLDDKQTRRRREADERRQRKGDRNKLAVTAELDDDQTRRRREADERRQRKGGNVSPRPHWRP